MAIFDYDADRDKKSIPPVLARILAFILLLSWIGAGGLAVSVGVQQVTESLASTSWPQTTGVVQSSTVDQMDSDSSSYAKIVYAYSVRGQNYTMDKLSFDGERSGSVYAENIVSQYPVGQTVTVYYSPSNPAEAVLRPGVSWSWWIPLLFGSLLVLSGLVCMAGLLRLIRRGNHPATSTPGITITSS